MTLTKDFEFGESQGTSVGIAFDGDPKPWYSALKKKAWLLSRSGTFYFSNLVTYCAASSSWKQTDFMFRGLDITESTNTRIQSAQLKALGQIQLTIQRTDVGNLLIPRPFPKKQLSRVAEVSEKTLKGSAISSTVSFTNEKRVAEPQAVKETMVAIPGPLGEPSYFTILYRSKRTLQILGCLQRTPSPEAQSAPNLNRPTEAMSHNASKKAAPKDHEQEIRDLRARLAQLEGNGIVKSEIPHTAGGIKRERGESSQGQSSSKRSRKSGAIETVDLTAD